MTITRTPQEGNVVVTFILGSEAPDGPVSVVGSFNDWTPGAHPFTVNQDGVRSVTIVVPATDEVHFRYLGPDGHWFDDSDADEVSPSGSVLRTSPSALDTEVPAPDTEDEASSLAAIHRSPKEALAEGPMPGFAEQDLLAERGEDYSAVDEPGAAPAGTLVGDVVIPPTTR